ncbi:hypothetical protein HS7_12540 [Sulfolobales archaeon HS-7]|nr:hypothetical protein HS7_12540 [Sulfolobales archaeon HS-7]
MIILATYAWLALQHLRMFSLKSLMLMGYCITYQSIKFFKNALGHAKLISRGAI